MADHSSNVVVTPKVESSYHRGDDAEKAVTVGAPAHDKYDESAGPRRKKFFCWSLPKKQWLLAVIGTIAVVLAVLLLIVFLAIIPAIFQKQVDKVKITLNHLDLVKMSGDRSSNEIGVDMSVHVTSDAMSHATMYSTEATLSYKGKAFGRVTLPETALKKGKFEFDMVIKGESDILDQAAFRDVSKAVVTEETLEVQVAAKVKIHAMGLSYGGLDLNRDVTVKGLNQFSNPISKITHISIPACTATEYQMLTNITLDNDSNIGLDGIGVLNMSVYYEQDYLGQAISTDGPVGIPRGAIPKQFLLAVKKEPATLKALGLLLKSILASKTQFYITGNNPYAVTQAVLLDEALTKLNMSVPYLDGLKSIELNPKPECADLLKLVTA